ncbi:isochorismatase family protein [Rhodococcus triatomae]|uniref:Bifunctional isochorismate lyase / aryl carrier protein n=1 Tax=Rhodococcus triatomae TaxID=300028 RepID=A0A1G7ZMY4_9NOCA|nr:isochorismatase family protein [Rhodococcus triatomae]QNG17999.1 isochorismatase family protein [Rhodococcus triatomae]QNG22333.1 isochorismatase family protein [Rhodococcus triatomae]SDH10122.1 bifunctional isochorismate lyase / aryl carrier protein [Rhodococcus triatomae]
MAIPGIAPYSLPGRPDVPEARVDWALDTDRCALLIHDMQKYFIDAYDKTAEPLSTALANIQAIRAACARASIPVIYTMQPGDQHPSRRGILADFWGVGLTTGRDTEVVEELAPIESDIQVTKWRYSAFQRTDLRQLLGHFGRDQLIVTGVYTHMGCMLSAADAFMNDVAPFLVADATADFSRDEHLMALDYTAKRCGKVTVTDDVVAAIEAGAHPALSNAALSNPVAASLDVAAKGR